MRLFIAFISLSLTACEQREKAKSPPTESPFLHSEKELSSHFKDPNFIEFKNVEKQFISLIGKYVDLSNQAHLKKMTRTEEYQNIVDSYPKGHANTHTTEQQFIMLLEERKKVATGLRELEAMSQASDNETQSQRETLQKVDGWIEASLEMPKQRIRILEKIIPKLELLLDKGAPSTPSRSKPITLDLQKEAIPFFEAFLNHHNKPYEGMEEFLELLEKANQVDKKAALEVAGKARPPFHSATGFPTVETFVQILDDDDELQSLFASIVDPSKDSQNRSREELQKTRKELLRKKLETFTRDLGKTETPFVDAIPKLKAIINRK